MTSNESMNNRETDAAWAYHDGTKHSYARIHAEPHYLDWENQPLPFKIYSDLEPIPLSRHLSSSDRPALEAIAYAKRGAEGRRHPTLQALAEILFLSAGITRRRQYPGAEMLFRAAACTGALYHIDLYIVCAELDQLTAGVYHFSPHDFALRRLRGGDFRRFLIDAAGEDLSLAHAPCAIVSASTFWRNAWKYRARAYRHCFWDNGTILANLLAAAVSRDIPANVVLGFVDAAVRRLLGLDERREAALSIVALGANAKPAAAAPFVDRLDFKTEPLSKSELDYPAMRMMHEASSLQSAEDVRAWRQSAATTRRVEVAGQPASALFPLQLPADQVLPQDPIETVILRRGSTRSFARTPIGFGALSVLLDRSTRGIECDFLSGSESLNDIYLIVHAVENLPAGRYRYRHKDRALELLRAGDFRRKAGELGLGQEIPADCSANIYFLADLHHALDRFGNRGYRAAQLEAAIMGGKLYLAAYAQGLGASGLTFFDDDVSEFFSPDAAGKSVMFLVAIGRSARRAAG